MIRPVDSAPTPDAEDTPLTLAAHKLAQLQDHTDEVRTELHQLRQQVVVAERLLGQAQAGNLLEANEQLVLASLQALTEADECEQALGEAARSGERDALTGLPNRLLLLDRFTQAIATARRHDGRLALLFMDMNYFKDVNDRLGHSAGDQALKVVAQRLVDSVREVDTVSRHGGDEFLVLLPELSQAADAGHIADKIIRALRAPLQVGDHELRLDASIGISLYPDHGEEAQVLIDHADAAMYRAKRRGLGGHAFHGEPSPDQENTRVPAYTTLHGSLTDHERALIAHQDRHVQMREANQQLVLAALGAQQLQAAAESAQQRQTELLAVVAHELRTPLTPIRIAVTMLGDGGNVLPRMQAIIERQVVHMSRLVDDLLDVSRANTGKLSLRRKALDMKVVLGEALEACRPAIDTRQQHLTLDLPAGPLPVHGDADRLVQVFSNLLDNARKYTPAAGEIGLAVKVVGAVVQVIVSDNGIGITAEALPKVFEPFVQDAQAVGFNRDGLGIGLTVVSELVEAHGGTVTANSPGSGLGSQFVVTLPLLAASEVAENSAGPGASSSA